MPLCMAMPVPCGPCERLVSQTRATNPTEFVLSPGSHNFAPANEKYEGNSRILRKRRPLRCRNDAGRRSCRDRSCPRTPQGRVITRSTEPKDMRRPHARCRLSTRAKELFMGNDYFAANPSNDSVSRLVGLGSCHHPRGHRASVHDSLLRDSGIGSPPPTLADGGRDHAVRPRGCARRSLS